MTQIYPNNVLPTFLVRSTLAVAIVSVLIVCPFGIYNFYVGREPIGILCVFIVLLCVLNSFLCLKNKYNKTLNFYIIAPLLTCTIVVIIKLMGLTGTYWAYQGMLALYFVLPEKPARVFNVIYFVIISITAWQVLEFEFAIRFISVLLGTSFFALFCMREIYKQHALLTKQTITDSLTGVNNRFILQTSLEQTINLTKRNKQSVSLFMIDLDHFKKINDQFGQDMGDKVLEQTGDFLRNFFRDSDMIFRLGGEEFLVIVNQCNHQQGVALAEKCRKEFENLVILDNHKVTISIGISMLKDGIDWKDWMKQADTKLYQAKKNGRNLVAV